MNSDQSTDVAVARQHDRMVVGEDRRQAVSHPAAEIVETLERRRTAPGHKECDRAFPAAQLAALEPRLDCSRAGGGFLLAAHRRPTRLNPRPLPPPTRF